MLGLEIEDYQKHLESIEAWEPEEGMEKDEEFIARKEEEKNSVEEKIK